MTQSTQQTDSSHNSSTQNYAGFQGPALQTAFNAANTALGQAQGATAPNGFTAQFTPAMMAAFQNELGAGSNPGSNPITQASTGAATGLTSAGTDAATSGLYNLSNFTPVGGTASNIANANAYAAADAPNIQGAVQNAMLGANQEYNDVTAPSIARNAATSGNTNSTAPAIQNGIVQRGLSEQAANLGASLSNSDFMNALNLSQNQNTQQNNTTLAQMLGMVSGGAQTAGTGVGAGTSAIGQTSNLFDIANTGASNLNAGNQANLTNQQQQYSFDVNSPFAALNNFYNIVGNKAWGSTTDASGTSTTTSTPSLMQDIMSGVGMAGSALSGLGGLGGMGGLGNLFSLAGSPGAGIGKIGA